MSYTRWGVATIEAEIDRGKIASNDATQMIADLEVHYEEGRISKDRKDSLQRLLRQYE